MTEHTTLNRWCRPALAVALAASILAQAAANPAPAHATGATADGKFTLSESVTAPEVSDTETVQAQFPGTDSLGLPTFPNGNNQRTCTITSSAGIAALLVRNTLQPCGAATSDSGGGTGKADRVIIDGYVLIPDGATGISLQMSNDHPDASTLYVGGNHLYSAPSDDRTSMEYRASINTPFQAVGSVSATVATLAASSVCANSPSVAFRAYVYDASSSHAFILKWLVTGGASDTGGAYQAIPSSFFSSLAGYDNDLDSNSVPDYQETDSDGDSFPTGKKWVKSSRATLLIPTATDLPTAATSTRTTTDRPMARTPTG